MNWMIDLAGVGGAIVVSMALALGLEWLSLRGLMLLMPAKAAPVPAAERTITQRAERQERRKAA